MSPLSVIGGLAIVSCLTLARKDIPPSVALQQPTAPSYSHYYNRNFHFGFPLDLQDSIVAASNSKPHRRTGPVQFSEGDGSKYETGHRSADGEKGSKGYESLEKHDTKRHETYGKNHGANENGEKGGNEKQHQDAASYYKKHHEGGEGHKSAKFGEKKGHKKGHKTKGYHNTFHKDEYHKEHKFYDDYHKSGFHEKDGQLRSYHEKKDGGRKKGGNHESAVHKNHHGHKGHTESGRLDDLHKGNKGKEGHQSFYKHFEDLGKKGGAEVAMQYGFVKGNHG